MTKTLNQWKIFFYSMNSKKINLVDFGLFLFNALLYLFLGGMNLLKGKNPFQWPFSYIWLLGAFMFFLRLFYNQTSLRFSKTLPCTKKLYTKYVWICFEIINVLFLLEWIIFWVISAAAGKDVSMCGVLFLFICFLHLVIAVVIPYTALILVQEEKITSSFGFQQMGTTAKLLLLELSSCVVFFGINWNAKKLIQNGVEINPSTDIWMIFVCLGFITLSGFLSRIIFNKIYKKLG